MAQTIFGPSSSGSSTSSSSGINYILNPDAETDTTGWATYADAAQATPVDGAGGSPNSTWTRTTNNILRGTGSFRWTKSGTASRQGEGVSYDMTIDRADQGKVLQISFDYYVVSGTYATGDLTVYVYDQTGVNMIQPAGYQIQSTTIQGKHTATFQTSGAAVTGYRFIIHTASTSALDYTLNFDNFKIGPQTVPYGTTITDPVAYTPIFTGWDTVSSVNFASWRVGKYLYVEGTWTSGPTPTAVEAQMTLGYNGVSGNVTSASTLPSRSVCGVGSGGTASATYFGGFKVLIETSVGYVTFGKHGSATNGDAKNNGNLFTGSVHYSLFCKVPIEGWSSSVQSSNDTDTRIVAAIISGNPASATSGNPLIVPTVGYDSHAVYNATTGRYTVPVPGVYKMFGALQSASSATTLNIYLNAVSNALAGNLDSNGEATYCAAVNCLAGDIIDIRPGGTVDPTAMTLHIERLSGPSLISATESVSARYYASATSISGSLATVVWTTKDFDSHNQMSSGVYTVPVAGKYQVNSALALAGTFALNNQSNFVIQKNSVTVSELLDYAGGAETADHVILSDVISCIAGDTLRVQVSSGATGPSIVSSNTKNYISIARVGN